MKKNQSHVRNARVLHLFCMMCLSIFLSLPVSAQTGDLGMIVYSPQANGSYAVSWGNPNLRVSSSAITFLPVTMNGDGKTQVLQIFNSNGKIGMMVYSPQPNGSYGVSWVNSNLGEGAGAITFLPVSMNGDGKTQILQLWNNNGALAMIVYSPQPNGSYAPTWGTQNIGQGAGAITFLPVHMNGDGKTQVAQLWNNNGALAMVVYSPQPNGSYAATWGTQNIGQGAGAITFMPVSMNGDGKTQIVQLFGTGPLGMIVYSPQPNGSYAATFGSSNLGENSPAITFLPVAMNGDGKTQILQLFNAGNLGMIAYSPQPNGSYAATFGSSNLGEGSPAITFLPVTMNGDGKTQVVQLWNANGELGLIVYSPQPNGSYAATFGSSNLGEGAAAITFLPVSMNGDGKTQILQLWNNNQQTSAPPPVVPPAPPNPCAADPCSAQCIDLYYCQCVPPGFVPGQTNQTSHQLRKTTLD